MFRNGWGAALALTLLVATTAIAGCGSSGSDTTSDGANAAPLSLKISETGKKATFHGPKSVKGGLVDVSLTNQGKAPHGVQLIQVTGGHTAADLFKAFSSNSNKTPEWIKFDGGIGTVAPGQTGKATVNLDPGNYVISDAAAFGPGSSGPPATAQLQVSSGAPGTLPGTSASITAAHTGKDKFAWKVSGLKTGRKTLTFDSKGKDALHLIFAVPVKNAPPLSQVKKDLASNGPPPPYADVKEAQQTAVLDGGKQQVTQLTFSKPGQYILFCPLTDRDGGKPHFEEGLLKQVTIK